MTSARASLAFLLVLLAATLAAAAPPVVTATKLTAPPTLDGKLDDAAWQQGQWYGGFTLLGEGMKPAAAQTRFKVAFDDRNLYFGAELSEPQMDQLKATVTEHDGRVHSDDVLEIMVVPSSARLDYYHFTVNALETQYEAEMRQGGNVRTTEWDPAWQSKVARGAQSWTVEVAIPFVELGLSSLSKDDWGLNVARERQAGTAELSSFTEGRGGFHQPSLYATLKLPGADLGRYMWTMRPPYETCFEAQGERLSYQGKIHLTNDSGKFHFLRIRPELQYPGGGHTSGPAITQGLDAGQARELAFSVPVRKQGNAVLRFVLSDRNTPDDPLYIRQVPLTLTYTPLAIRISRPCYRDCIYATQKLDRVEFTVTSALSAEDLKGKQLHAVLLAAAADGKRPEASRATPAAAAPQVKLSLPADKLAVGDYTLLVTLLDRGGQVVHSAQKPLRKLPPPSNGHEWRIDEHNVLLHNGQPFLPFGWFSQGIDNWDPKDGYTVLQEYSREYFTDDVVRAWMDPIAAAGAYVTFSPYSPAFMNRDEAMKRPLNEQERTALQARVNALKDHPALLAWYMADEPELVPVLPQRAQEIYEVVREADPYHPCIMLNDTMEGIRRYERGGDILMPDPYPCFLKGGLAASPLEKTSQFMKTISEATGGSKPAWVTPQGFNYGDYNRAGNRGPTLTEMRNQNYQAVAYGAKGFIWYTYGQCRNYPDLYLGMPFLAREMADLKPAVLADEVAGAVTVKARQPEHLHVSLRQIGGELTLFAVNTATEPQEATITVKGAPATLFVVSEGRKVSLAGGSFSDHFDTYGNHVYSTNEKLSNREQLATVQAAIDRDNAARNKPGNLAFEDTGARVVVSSGARYGNTPDRVLDGMPAGMGWLSLTPKKLGEWLQVIWPSEQTVGRVVAFSTTIGEAEVQVPAEGDQWRTVAKLSGQPLTATFEPVKAKTIRLLVTALLPEKTQSSLQEVEVYAK